MELCTGVLYLHASSPLCENTVCMQSVPKQQGRQKRPCSWSIQQNIKSQISNIKVLAACKEVCHSMQPSKLGSTNSKCRTLDVPDPQQPPAAAVAAVEAAAALLAAETAGSRTDDAVSRLAEAGPLSLRLLLRLEQWCRPGNENLADSMMQHASLTASRQATF